jgi:hypothetical protein
VVLTVRLAHGLLLLVRMYASVAGFFSSTPNCSSTASSSAGNTAAVSPPAPAPLASAVTSRLRLLGASMQVTPAPRHNGSRLSHSSLACASQSAAVGDAPRLSLSKTIASRRWFLTRMMSSEGGALI